ncbi:nucleotide sugar dehydrogenase [Niabella insulamsoli]|uniref:nucleotide sugar dehydrogenase n=1 Tax=Niabella insulamsoli TaxID=3144874 RepID=UPI0031FE2122
MYEELIAKKAKLAVIGLGYVGLPVALAFAKKLSVIGFDINEARVRMMQQGIDPSNELDAAAFEDCDISFTHSLDDLKTAQFYIVAVPTPVDDKNNPDLSLLLRASETLGAVVQKGNYIIFESTVYPGCTEEDCLPLIEKISGLQNKIDFKTGYSPERINPGDKVHTIQNITKIVSGCDKEALETIAKVYELIVEAGVFRASSIKVAEAAKIVENAQRDLNIAFMNELSIVFDQFHINTFEVLEAAATKWNFLNFQPGLVGGHCTGVDPYYLAYRSGRAGYKTQLILAARHINDYMPKYVAEQIVKHIIKSGSNVAQSGVLIMGATFKENVSDVRNSKVADIVKALREFSVAVDVEDPYAVSEDLEQEYDIRLTQKISDNYDAVIIAVPHQDYLSLDDAYFCSITKPNALIADLKGIFRNKIFNRPYYSL